MLSRREFIAGCSAGLGTLAASQGRAQSDYPRSPIQVVVPFPAGGPADVTMRILAEEMGRRLGQGIVIENKGGAGGNIGAGAAARAAADGYTLFWASGGTHGINPSLYKKLPYEPQRDFRGVILGCTLANIFVAHPKFPASDMAGLIAHARANPGKLSYATAGIGTTTHMSAELLRAMTGIDIVHIPYRGGGPAMNDLLGGHVELMVDGLSTSLPHIQDGKLKALGVTPARPDPSAPTIPTVGATVPGYETVAWFALLAPKATPEPIVQRLNAVAAEALASPELKRRYAELGVHPGSGTPGELDAFIASEIEKWRKVVDVTRVSAE